MKYTNVWWIVVSLLMVQMHFCDCILCWFGHSDHKELLTMNGQYKWCEIVIQLEKNAENDEECRILRNSTNKGIYYGFTNSGNTIDFGNRHDGEYAFSCNYDECNTEDFVKLQVWKTLDSEKLDNQGDAKCINKALDLPKDENIDCFDNSTGQIELKPVSRRNQSCAITFYWKEASKKVLEDDGEIRLTMNGINGTNQTRGDPDTYGCKPFEMVKDENGTMTDILAVSCYCRTSKCNNKYNLKVFMNTLFSKYKMNAIRHDFPELPSATLEFSKFIDPTTITPTNTTTMLPAASQSQPTSTDCQPCQCVNNGSSANSAMSSAQTAPLNSQSSQKDNSENSDTTSHIVIYCLAALSFIGFLGLCAMAWMIMKLRKELNAGLITASSMGSVPRSVGTETPKTSRTSVLPQ